jgi:hypothetical protein
MVNYPRTRVLCVEQSIDWYNNGKGNYAAAPLKSTYLLEPPIGCVLQNNWSSSPDDITGLGGKFGPKRCPDDITGLGLKQRSHLTGGLLDTAFIWLEWPVLQPRCGMHFRPLRACLYSIFSPFRPRFLPASLRRITLN